MVDVLFGTKGRDFDFLAVALQLAPNGAKGSAHLPRRSAKGGDQPQNVVRAGVRREIDIVGFVVSRENGVANTAPNGVEGEAFVRKRLGQGAIFDR